VSGLSLVAGGRVGESQGTTSAAERVLRIHPEDARERDIEGGDRVAIANEEQTIEASVELDDDVRSETVYLPARAADPLLRRGSSAVTVTPLPEADRA